MSKEVTLAAGGESYVMLPFSVYKEPRFLELIKILRDAEVAFLHLEVPLHNYEGYPSPMIWRATCARAPPIIADELKWAGIDMVSTAHNHIMDYGIEGLFSTMKHLDRVNIVQAGIGHNLGEARAPAYLSTDKARVALISTTPSFPDAYMASEVRRDMKGRPGINPQRFETCYIVDEETYMNLQKYNEQFGLFQAPLGHRMGPPSKEELAKKELTIPNEGRNKEAGRRWIKVGENIGMHTYPYKPDLEGNLRSVKDARRMADIVLLSIHSHEADRDVEIPAEFCTSFARACIDAGVDAILGHGPHILRGIEIYKGKPIFYGLGNFFIQNSTIEILPQQEYETAGLSFDATPADYYDRREYREGQRRRGNYKNYESILAQIKFKITPLPNVRPNSTVTEIKLHPLTLHQDNPRGRRGWPTLANKDDAYKIITRLGQLSAPFGTKIVYDEKQSIGIVELPE